MQNNPATESDAWKAPADVVARRIRGEMLLVPIRRSSEALDGFFTLNSTAADIWSMARDGASIPAIVNQVTATYQVSADEAARDVSRVIGEMQEAGVLIKRTIAK